LNEDFCTTINGETVREPVAPLRALFAKLKARDNLLGDVLTRLGADPGAQSPEANNAVGRLLADREAVSKIADCYVKAAEEIAQGLGLSATKPDELAAQVLAMNTELSSALAKAQERVKELEDDAKDREEFDQLLEDTLGIGEHSDGVIATIKKMQARLSSLEAPPLGWVQKKIAKLGALVGLEGADLDAVHQGVKAALLSSQAEVKALADENAILRSGVEAERNYKLHAWAATGSANSRIAELEAEIEALKLSLEVRELERVLACARVTGLAAELQAFEHAMREKLRT
jgi:chromosome segregation ATPase